LDEDEERLIAKIQMEFTKGSAQDLLSGGGEWDIGLLYVTSENLWFVNRQKERTQISFADINGIGDVIPWEGDIKTDFSEALNAEFSVLLRFDDEGSNMAINVSGPQSVLSALRSQVVVRAGVTDSEEETGAGPDQSKMQLFRKISVFLNMDLPIIADPKMLEYFLGIEQQEFVNILVERAQMSEGA